MLNAKSISPNKKLKALTFKTLALQPPKLSLSTPTTRGISTTLRQKMREKPSSKKLGVVANLKTTGAVATKHHLMLLILSRAMVIPTVKELTAPTSMKVVKKNYLKRNKKSSNEPKTLITPNTT